MSDVRRAEQEVERAVAAKARAERALGDAQRKLQQALAEASKVEREQAEAGVEAQRESQATAKAAFLEGRRG